MKKISVIVVSTMYYMSINISDIMFLLGSCIQVFP